MRGDQLARWRMIRAVEANSKGLTETERPDQKETSPGPTSRTLETFQAAGFPLYAQKVERASRWIFIDSFKFRIPLINLYFESKFWHAKGQRLARKGIQVPFPLFASGERNNFWHW
jgi:hypothetical protein